MSRRRHAALGWLAICIGCGLQQSSDAWRQVGFGAALTNPAHAIWSEAAPDVFEAHIETSKGVFVVEVHRDWAPRGADRFFNLVRVGFFDDSRFFRVRAGFGVGRSPSQRGPFVRLLDCSS